MFSPGQTIEIELDRNRFLQKEVRLSFCYKQMKLRITCYLHYPWKKYCNSKTKNIPSTFKTRHIIPCQFTNPNGC